MEKLVLMVGLNLGSFLLHTKIARQVSSQPSKCTIDVLKKFIAYKKRFC